MSKYGLNKKCYIISELCGNHQGSLETAKEMILESMLAGADCVKIQKRDLESLSQYAKDKIYDSPNSFGKTYYEHRAALEFSINEIEELYDYAKSLDLDFSASCWDKKSVDDMEPYVDFYKIQSADSHNKELIKYVFSKGKPVIMSVGGTSFEDVDSSVVLAHEMGVDLAILHCTPIYPLPFDMVNLNNLLSLQEMTDVTGYSGHEKGIAVSVAAVALGAKIIERHFTLDRSMKGSDQAASLEPQGFAKLVRDIRSLESALGSFDKIEYSDEVKKLESLNLTRKPFNWESDDE